MVADFLEAEEEEEASGVKVGDFDPSGGRTMDDRISSPTRSVL